METIFIRASRTLRVLTVLVLGDKCIYTRVCCIICEF